MAKVYSKPEQYSICRAGLEVYKTDEDNFKPYVSSGAVQSSSSTDSSDDKKAGFDYHQGTVLETYYYANLQSISHEYDYGDMNSNSTIKVDTVDKNRFYKGVRVSVKKEWEAPNESLVWEDLKPVNTGFISEQTFSEDGVEIKVDGYSKLLDQKFNFEFKNMKRSVILEEIIKTAGLVPVVNVKGLDDDVTNFSTKSSSESSGSNSELAGGEGETIDSLVEKIVGDETNELKKCKLVHQWLKENVRYSRYDCTRYNTPEKCLENKVHLNCADTARLTRAMMASAGLDCYVVHRTTNGGHFWVIIEIDGKKYASDQTGNGSEFNTVWAKSGRTSVSDGGSYTRKNGKNPDC